jgi:hypothetical protein
VALQGKTATEAEEETAETAAGRAVTQAVAGQLSAQVKMLTDNVGLTDEAVVLLDDDGEVAVAEFPLSEYESEEAAIGAAVKALAELSEEALAELDDEEPVAEEPAAEEPAEKPAEGAKVGKRVRADKLAILRKLKAEFSDFTEAFKEAWSGFMEWAGYEDQQAEPHVFNPLDWLEENKKSLEEQGCAGFAFKARDGKAWWLQFTTNAFQDREREFFTTKSIQDYIDRHRSDEAKGEFWYRHIPGTKFADVKWQALIGRFLAQAGPFDDTPIGSAFKGFFLKHPDGHPLVAPNGWGTSHGYLYNEKDRNEDGVYNWFEIKESTVLPLHIASNPWNPYPQILTEAVKMDEQQKQDLLNIGGQNLVEMITKAGEQKTKELEDLGVGYKASEAADVSAGSKADDSKADTGLKAGYAERIRAVASKIDDDALKQSVMDYCDRLEKETGKKEEEPSSDNKPEDEKAGKMAKYGQELRMIAGKAKGAVATELRKIADEMVGESPEEKKDISREEIGEALLTMHTALRDEIAESRKAVVAEIAEVIAPLVESIKSLQREDEKKIADLAEETPAASLSDIVQGFTGVKSAKVKLDSKLGQSGPAEAPFNDDDWFVHGFARGADQKRGAAS